MTLNAGQGSPSSPAADDDAKRGERQHPSNNNSQSLQDDVPAQPPNSHKSDMATIDEDQPMRLNPSDMTNPFNSQCGEGSTEGGRAFAPASQSAVTSPAAGPHDSEPGDTTSYWPLGRTITTQSHPDVTTGTQRLGGSGWDDDDDEDDEGNGIVVEHRGGRRREARVIRAAGNTYELARNGHDDGHLRQQQREQQPLISTASVDDEGGNPPDSAAATDNEHALLLSRGTSFQSNIFNRLSLWLPQRRRGRYDDYMSPMPTSSFTFSAVAGAGAGTTPGGDLGGRGLPHQRRGKKKRGVGGERVWYASYTAIDWSHDTIKEQARLRALRCHKGWHGWWLNHVYDPAKGWVLVILVGILCGFFAGFITEWTEWLSSLKHGVCVGDWLQGGNCCLIQDRQARDASYARSGAPPLDPTAPYAFHVLKDTCPNWKSWSQLLSDAGIPTFGSDGYVVNFLGYTALALLFNFVASWMVVQSATDVIVTPGVSRSVAPSSMEVDITPTKKRAYYGAGSGIPEVKSILSGFVIHGFLGVRILFVKTFGLILSVASGVISGKEGPMVQIASCLGNITTRLFDKYNRNESKKREIISAAAAAGVSVAFGAPIGGVLFSLEEVSYFFPNKTMLRSYFSALVAAIVLKMYDPFKTGKLVMFGVTYDMTFKWFELGFFILIGIFGGLWGPFYNRLNMGINRLRKNSVLGKHPIVEVLVITALTATFSYHTSLTRIGLGELVGTLFSECHNNEDNQMGLCVDGSLLADYWPIFVLLLVTLLNRSFFAIITFGMRVPSGLVLPSMTVGAVFGRLLGTFVEYQIKQHPNWPIFSSCPANGSRCIIPGLYALVGAGATLTGVSRTTISVAVILFELTGSLTYTLPVMVSIITAKWVADCFNPKGIYDLLIENAGHPYLETKTEYIFNKRTAGELMETDIEVIQTNRDNSLNKIRRKLAKLALRGYSDGGLPIVDSRGMLIGYIACNEIEYALSQCSELPSQTPCFFDNPLVNSSVSAGEVAAARTELFGEDPAPSETPMRRCAPIPNPDQFHGTIQDSSDSTDSSNTEYLRSGTSLLTGMVRSIEGAFSRLADAVRGERKPLNSLPTTYGTTSTAVASNAGITAAGQHASAEAGDSPPPLYHYSSYSIPVPLLQEKPNDMTPYVDQAPMTVLVNTPIEQVMALFAHLGINYVCVTYHGQYRGIIFKKRLIGYLSELDKAGMTH